MRAASVDQIGDPSAPEGPERGIHGEATRATDNPDAELRIGMPAGVITAAAEVRLTEGQWVALRGSFLRTQRRLFEGSVLVRGSRAVSS